ncbi:hypothetical protein LC040_18710 [Bacillus tianshenii]|nr:hypothetical protein LC040_18710 [Bacillus tianshenii]
MGKVIEFASYQKRKKTKVWVTIIVPFLAYSLIILGLSKGVEYHQNQQYETFDTNEIQTKRPL